MSTRTSSYGRTLAAFSLLEVMVVVAIITLMLAILVPSLSKAKAQSRNVLCLSNVHQLTSATLMFLEANNGVFPHGVNMEHNFGGRQGKGSLVFGNNPKKPKPKFLNTYFKLPTVTRGGADVFRCPCDGGVSDARPTAFEYYGSSYSTNEWLIGQDQIVPPADDPCEQAIGLWTSVNTRLPKLTASSIKDPKRLILLGDATWYFNYERGLPQDFPYWHGVPYRHNIGFLDGSQRPVVIRKGIYVCDQYTVLSSMDLATQVTAGSSGPCQAEVKP